MKGLYIHIPFCTSICNYCDFPKELAKESKKNAYINALMEEFVVKKYFLDALDTVYIGGGTPSALNTTHLKKLFDTIKQHTKSSPISEYTIECNPEDLTLEKAEQLKNSGITRVSLGVQTFHRKHLQLLNRKHTKDTVIQSIQYLHDVGINNINIDMIFSIPTQTLEDLKTDLKELKSLPITHISYYSLILEEHTVFDYWHKQGKLLLQDEDTEACMFEEVIDTLTRWGYEHYEVSNFALKGYRSKHNLNYWRDGDFIGLGCGAHSKLKDKRYANARSVKAYIDNAGQPIAKSAEQWDHEGLKDTLIMGLRLLEGIDVSLIEKKYQVNLFESYPELNKFIEQKMLCYKDHRLHFTKKGLMLGNLVFGIF